MDDEDRISGLAALLIKTGHSHHNAFLATDGTDPEWPLWYSKYLQDKVGAFLDVDPTRSKIIQCLLNADEAHSAPGAEQPCPAVYSNVMYSIGEDGLRNSDEQTGHSQSRQARLHHGTSVMLADVDG